MCKFIRVITDDNLNKSYPTQICTHILVITIYTDYSTTVRIKMLFHWRCAEMYRGLETVSTAF